MSIEKKEVRFIMIKRSIHQEDMTIINIYASPNKSPKTHEAKIDI